MDPITLNYDNTLSEFAAGYSVGKYIADLVCPIVLVDDKAGTYKKRSLTEMISSHVDDLIASGGEANEVSYDATDATYVCIDRALKELVPRHLLDRNPLTSREKVTRFVMNKLLHLREIRVADLLLTAANYATSNTANASDWTDESSGTPLSDIDTGIAAVSNGMEGDTKLVAATSLEMWQALRKHPDLRGGGAEGRVLTTEQVASLIGVDEIHVSDTQKNTADPEAAVTKARIWGTDKFAIVRVPVGDPDDEQGLFAATFRHRPISDGGGVMVRRWDEPGKGAEGSEAVQCSFSDAEQVVQNDAGYLLTGLTA